VPHVSSDALSLPDSQRAGGRLRAQSAEPRSLIAQQPSYGGDKATNDKDNPSMLLGLLEPVILSPCLSPLLKGDQAVTGLPSRSGTWTVSPTLLRRRASVEIVEILDGSVAELGEDVPARTPALAGENRALHRKKRTPFFNLSEVGMEPKYGLVANIACASTLLRIAPTYVAVRKIPIPCSTLSGGGGGYGPYFGSIPDFGQIENGVRFSE